MGGKNGIVLTTKKRWFPNSLSIPSAFQSLLGRGLAASLEILAKSVPPSLYSAAGADFMGFKWGVFFVIKNGMIMVNHHLLVA